MRPDSVSKDPGFRRDISRLFRVDVENLCGALGSTVAEHHDQLVAAGALVLALRVLSALLEGLDFVVGKLEGVAVGSDVPVGELVDTVEQEALVPGVGLNQGIQAGGHPADVPRERGHIDVVVFSERVKQRLRSNLHDVKRLTVHAATPVKKSN